jgi:hypothetical protein
MDNRVSDAIVILLTTPESTLNRAPSVANAWQRRALHHRRNDLEHWRTASRSRGWHLAVISSQVASEHVPSLVNWVQSTLASGRRHRHIRFRRRFRHGRAGAADRRTAKLACLDAAEGSLGVEHAKLAAVQRDHLPSRQRVGLRLVLRAIEIIDSIGCSCASFAGRPSMLRRVTVNLRPLAQ